MRTVLFALLGAATLATTAIAGDHHREMPEPAEAAQRMSEHLGLDDETRETVESILEGSRVRAEPLMEKVKAAHEELKALREAGSGVDKKVRKLVGEIADAKAELTLLKMATSDEIEALLTPEQAQRFRRARMAKERGGHHRRGGESVPGLDSL